MALRPALAHAGVAAGSAVLAGLVGGELALRVGRRRWRRDIAGALRAERSRQERLPALLVTKAEAAERLGVGLRTVERMLSEGELRPVKLGRSTRLVVAELDAFVAELKARRE